MNKEKENNTSESIDVNRINKRTWKDLQHDKTLPSSLINTLPALAPYCTVSERLFAQYNFGYHLDEGMLDCQVSWSRGLRGYVKSSKLEFGKLVSWCVVNDSLFVEGAALACAMSVKGFQWVWMYDRYGSMIVCTAVIDVCNILFVQEN